jgi:hypothetical protein
MLKNGMIMVVLVGVVLLAGAALAQDKPVGTIKFTGGSVSIGVGYSWGSGVLTFEGKEYPFEVDGLAVGVAGGSSISASGNVYKLTKLEDFNGNYAAMGAQGTIGGGAGATTMQNQNGVVINIVSTTVGLEFKFATGGVKFKLK